MKNFGMDLKMPLDRYGHYIPTESQGHINLLNS